MYKDRHFQTGDYPGNQVRIMRKLETVVRLKEYDMNGSRIQV